MESKTLILLRYLRLLGDMIEANASDESMKPVAEYIYRSGCLYIRRHAAAATTHDALRSLDNVRVLNSLLEQKFRFKERGQDSTLSVPR